MDFPQYWLVMGYKPMMVVVSLYLTSGNSSLLMRKKGLPHQYAAQVVFQRIKIRISYSLAFGHRSMDLICQAWAFRDQCWNGRSGCVLNSKDMSNIFWLVVSNIWIIFFIYWECHHPNWRFPSFFRGVAQPPTSFPLQNQIWVCKKPRWIHHFTWCFVRKSGHISLGPRAERQVSFLKDPKVVGVPYPKIQLFHHIFPIKKIAIDW